MRVCVCCIAVAMASLTIYLLFKHTLYDDGCVSSPVCQLSDVLMSVVITLKPAALFDDANKSK